MVLTYRLVLCVVSEWVGYHYLCTLKQKNTCPPIAYHYQPELAEQIGEQVKDRTLPAAYGLGPGQRTGQEQPRLHEDEHEQRQSCRTQRCIYIFTLLAFIHTYSSSARIAARDAHVRESWVRAMEARIVRDQLQSCYRTEGVNHYETCRELSEKYTILLRENRVSFSTLLEAFS